MRRRDLTKGCCSAIAAMIGGQLNSFAFDNEDNKERDILVVLFLRGGCDSLSLIAPADDKEYIAARGGDLAVGTKGKNAGLELHASLDKTPFWLHPKANALLDIFKQKELAIIHACGLTNGTRSHFDAIDFMERGTPENKSTATGWLSRHLTSIHAGGITPALSIGNSTPVSLLGNTSAISMDELKNFNIGQDPKLTSMLKRLYAGDTLLHQSGRSTLEALEFIKSKATLNDKGEFASYVPEGQYPTGWPAESLSKSLQTVAQLIKMEVGMQVATVDYGGWDTHEGQTWLFPQQVEALSRSLGAFYDDLHRYHKRLTIVVMSEFGRRLKANNSSGTDHGHGGAMLVLGGNTLGGKMYGKWPGLATEQLDDSVDLAVTTDYRTVLSEILTKRLANPQIEQVFPGFKNYAPLGFC